MMGKDFFQDTKYSGPEEKWKTFFGAYYANKALESLHTVYKKIWALA